jgi:HrpA-like RNA helicase
VARRVAEELKVPVGGAVGYQVRFTDNVCEQTAVKFMTDGILLAEIQSDRWLSAYDTIIVDEAHERSLNIDFLLGYLKQLIERRKDLKIIVTSATIDTARFSAHFNDAPVVSVEGRGYPVDVRWRPIEGEGEDAGDRTVLDGILGACDEIARDHPMGDTLIFLPGEREIRDAHQALERRKYRHTEMLPLYARLSAKDQDRVFNPGPKRAHRARDQRRRNLADGAAHPRGRRSGPGAREALQPAAETRSPAHRTDQPGQRRPAQGPLRPHSRRARAIACIPKPISNRARASPIRKSAAPRWRA